MRHSTRSRPVSFQYVRNKVVFIHEINNNTWAVAFFGTYANRYPPMVTVNEGAASHKNSKCLSDLVSAGVVGSLEGPHSTAQGYVYKVKDVGTVRGKLPTLNIMAGDRTKNRLPSSRLARLWPEDAAGQFKTFFNMLLETPSFAPMSHWSHRRDPKPVWDRDLKKGANHVTVHIDPYVLGSLSFYLEDIKTANNVTIMRDRTHPFVHIFGAFHERRAALAEVETLAATISSWESEEMCSICYHLPTDGIYGIVDKCHHFFCYKCVDKWFEQHNTCPTCRGPSNRAIPWPGQRDPATRAKAVAFYKKAVGLVLCQWTRDGAFCPNATCLFRHRWNPMLDYVDDPMEHLD